MVPALTMRLLSEEKRTGTLEMLLTAPVNETPIVLGKFFAALVFFVVLWVPWALLLVALRIEGGQPFDYYPLFSFFVVLLCTGAHFVSMGLFFSAVTRNQIISAVFTFLGMFLLTMVLFAKRVVEGMTPPGTTENPWVNLLTHISYLDLWITSLDGKLIPKYLLFHLSATVLWLFATVKVLDIRRWW
jgi:ABC-type transport system involved in multi-copper enzyme maturation permease subunit